MKAFISSSETSLRAAKTRVTAAGSAFVAARPLPAAPRMAANSPFSDSENPRIEASAASFSDSENPRLATSVPSADTTSFGSWLPISHSLARDVNGR